ncbi:hypothetical protein EXIGLDRAFT_760490 [Exidia glandulosa HHB12029]|uniref:MYND-type domain-containing protein n=1 Tax=Exidia glandulosa HHB12029 TaxID=1314781 RepID=A0A165PAJ1_EXIGL|nr:hypothetical protein EXIGLDRAFT_760490 [Exidia glandulosa HHB12029]
MDALDRLAKGLERDLRDPYNPTFCVDCVGTAMERLFSDEKQQHANALHLQQNHHALLTSIMTYMTVPRVEEDMAELEALLLRTMATCPGRANHGVLQNIDGVFPDDALRTLLHPVRVCLEASSKLLRTQLFSRRGVWPRLIEDIIPRGPRESLAVLLFWLNRSGSYKHWVPLTAFGPFFCTVFEVCRLEFISELEADDMRTLFIDMICQQLDLAASILREKSCPHIPAHLRMGTTSAVLRTVCIGAGIRHSTYRAIVEGSQLRLLESLTAAADSVDARSFPGIKEQLVSLQMGIHLTMGPTHQVPQPIVDFYASMHKPLQEDVRLDLYFRLRAIDNDVACNAPDCRTHTRKTPTGKLQRCGGCRLLKYCTRECQKRHWNLYTAPHRWACLKLKELFAVAQFTLAPMAFVAACKASSLPDAFYEEIYCYLSADLNAEITAEAISEIEALD